MLGDAVSEPDHQHAVTRRRRVYGGLEVGNPQAGELGLGFGAELRLNLIPSRGGGGIGDPPFAGGCGEWILKGQQLTISVARWPPLRGLGDGECRAVEDPTRRTFAQIVSDEV